MSSHELEIAALAYHAAPPAGKIEVSISKPTNTQDDLPLLIPQGWLRL